MKTVRACTGRWRPRDLSLVHELGSGHDLSVDGEEVSHAMTTAHTIVILVNFVIRAMFVLLVVHMLPIYSLTARMILL